MARDYDELFDHARAGKVVKKHDYIAADEMVFGTFLLQKRKANRLKIVTRRSMAENTDANGRHALVFTSLQELRKRAMGAKTAPFGRKLRTTVSANNQKKKT